MAKTNRALSTKKSLFKYELFVVSNQRREWLLFRQQSCLKRRDISYGYACHPLISLSFGFIFETMKEIFS